MNILSIPSMSLLFDYSPAVTAGKYDSYKIFIADNKWPSLMQSLSEDLKLRLSSNGKSLYREQNRVATIVTDLKPLEGANPFA